MEEPAFDLYGDKSEPRVSKNAVVYFINIDHDVTKDLHWTQRPNVYVEVDTYGWATVKSYFWFGESSVKDGLKHPISTDILNWLQEWELVELRQIGPEDSEWFATDKLIKHGDPVTTVDGRP